MKTRINTRYQITTFAAVFTTLAYGVMRLLEGGTYNAWQTHIALSFYMSAGMAGIIVCELLLMRNSPYTPLVIVSSISIAFAAGAYITTEWDYYFLTLLGLIGLICLYGERRSLVLYIVLSIAQNAVVFWLLAESAPSGFLTHMLMSFLMYFFCAVYVIALFSMGRRREGVAQSGLQAFSSLLGSTPNLMVIIDSKRRVRYISAPLAKFAGMDEAAAVGRPFIDLFQDENLKLMFADILDTEDFYSATREIDVDDEPHYFKIIADKLSDHDAGMFIEITDMTEIVLASMAADQSRKEAEAANHSKSAFLTTMSHEIRTPMNAIIGVSEIQLLRDDLPREIVQVFRQIHTSGHGLLGIINDILDLSKIETGKLELRPAEYELASMIHDAAQLNMVRIGSKPIEFLLDLTPDLPAKLIGDELRIKQVLNNVLSNAFKYTDAGTVRLSVSHRVVPKGVELTFVVADTGQGMRPDDLSVLFDAYTRFNQTTNRTTEGTGLGMNITRRLVDMMDGRLDVESEYGRGSTFTITVLQKPAADRSVLGAEYAEKLRNFTFSVDREIQSIHITREPMPYGRVLVVDDLETNLYVARGLLAPYGLTIDTALSGFEAIEKIDGGSRYDIVFMDHMMPKMDGVETVQRLRAGGYRGVIVALTANAIAGNDRFFKESGFEDFISKPIDIRQMNAVLNKYIRDRRASPAPASEKAAEPLPEKPAGPLPEKAAEPLPEKPAGPLAEMPAEPSPPFDAGQAMDALSQAIQSGDLARFAQVARTVRDGCAQAGQADLSRLAQMLERAADMGDRAYLDGHAQGLIRALAALAGQDEA